MTETHHLTELVAAPQGQPSASQMKPTQALEAWASIQNRGRTAIRSIDLLAVELAEFWDDAGYVGFKWGANPAAYICATLGVTRGRLDQLIRYGRVRATLAVYICNQSGLNLLHGEFYRLVGNVDNPKIEVVIFIRRRRQDCLH